MAQGTISKEKIDETFANRFKDTFKDIIEANRWARNTGVPTRSLQWKQA